MARACELDFCSLPEKERQLLAKNLRAFIQERLAALSRQLAEAEARVNAFAVKYGQDLNSFAETRLPEVQYGQEYGDYISWYMNEREAQEYRHLIEEYEDLARQAESMG
jgi:hypothetical protein